MRVAREMPNLTSTSNLGTGKLFMLLDVPSEQREEFIASNPVEDMTKCIMTKCPNGEFSTVVSSL
jgi:hypothetical protein